MEFLAYMGRVLLALALLLVAAWWLYSYGMATFDPEPYWRGVLSVVIAGFAWRVWPRGEI